MVVVTDAVGNAALVLDRTARMPGRGAWLHPDLDCLSLAEQRRAFGRALRHAGPLDDAELRATLVALLGQPDATPGTTRDDPGSTTSNREAG